MAQRLFTVGKVPVLLEGFSSGSEKRKSDPETKVIVLSCSITPFNAKLAASMDSGLQGAQNIRSTIFDQTGDGAPRPGFPDHGITIDLVRQDLHMHHAPDSPESTFMLDHVKIRNKGVVKAHKDNPNNLTLTFKAVVGPCSGKELGEIQKWYRAQRFITFKESDPSLEFEEVDDADDGEPEKTEGGEGQPELEDVAGLDAENAAAQDPANRKLLSHAAGRKKGNKKR